MSNGKKGYKVKLLYDGVAQLLQSAEIGDECTRVAKAAYGGVPHTSIYAPHNTGQRMAVNVWQDQDENDMESNNLLKGASADDREDNT